MERPTSAPFAGELAGLGDGRVVLADVDAVGAELRGELGPIVEDEEGAGVGCGVAEEAGGGTQGRVRRVLVAELDQVGAAGERRLEQALELDRVEARVADEIQARVGEPGGAGGGVHRPQRSLGRTRGCGSDRTRIYYGDRQREPGERAERAPRSASTVRT